jgi:hypothetical protein
MIRPRFAIGLVLILAGLAATIGAVNMYLATDSFYYHRLAPALLAACWGWLGFLGLAFFVWAAARGLRQ